MSISQFVEKSGAQMRIFDLGSRIRKISKADFASVESQSKPYPHPYLKHAWLGILTWNPKKEGQHNIWFLKLPLDEQNFLQPGPRDAFLQHWLNTLQYPDKEHGEAPCYYKPDQHRMAYFHATAVAVLGQEHTRYYDTTRAYCSGDMGWDNWQQLGLQGLAEIVVNIDRDNNAQLVAQAITNMPQAPLNTLLGFLENIRPDHALSIAINDRLAEAIKQNPSAADLAAFVRAISDSQNIPQRRLLLLAILQHEQAKDIEVLASISSRCTEDLSAELLHAYLEALAQNNQGQEAFNALIGELMLQPGMREHILTAFRKPERSEVLSSAIGALMSGVRNSQAPES